MVFTALTAISTFFCFSTTNDSFQGINKASSITISNLASPIVPSSNIVIFFSGIVHFPFDMVPSNNIFQVFDTNINLTVAVDNDVPSTLIW